MPAGGGDPKVIGDGQTVVIRPEFSRGGSDLWDMKDIVVALLEEREELRAALIAAAVPGIAALPRRVVLLDHVGV